VIEDQTAVRIAENQSRFRDANERIEATADRMQFAGLIPFVCECPRESCAELTRLTLEEYEEIRQHPRRFFTAPDHQDISVSSGAAIIVAQTLGFVTVDKVGVAGDVAAERYGICAE
jgi:hypothetical protein